MPVYHGDMLEGMAMFSEHSFDCVILSQALQQTLEPVRTVEEMLRIGRRAIISFPNFGHWRLRLQLLLRGKMPVTRLLPYDWYETPNVHPLSVKDFHQFCKDRRLSIAHKVFFSPSYVRLPSFAANLLAGIAVFVIQKRAADEP